MNSVPSYDKIDKALKKKRYLNSGNNAVNDCLMRNIIFQNSENGHNVLFPKVVGKIDIS